MTSLVKLFPRLLTSRASAFTEMLGTLVELGKGLEFLAENPDAEMPDRILDLVQGVFPSGHGEDVV